MYNNLEYTGSLHILFYTLYIAIMLWEFWTLFTIFVRSEVDVVLYIIANIRNEYTHSHTRCHRSNVYIRCCERPLGGDVDIRNIRQLK